MIRKKEYVEIRYNTDKIQMLCIKMYHIEILPNIKCTYNQIDLIEK